MRAWPPIEKRFYDGWLLGFSAAYSRRANSISPLYDSTLDIEKKIAYCEAVYAERRQDTFFKLTAASRPAELDSILETKGYERQAETSVQTLDLSSSTAQADPRVVIHRAFSEGWLGDFARLSGLDKKHMKAARGILGGIFLPADFAALQQDGRTLAVGLGVLDGEYYVIQDVVTDPEARGGGLGTSLLHTLLHRAQQSGTKQACLQVMVENEAARGLYAKLGFREAYRYWYRHRRSGK